MKYQDNAEYNIGKRNESIDNKNVVKTEIKEKNDNVEEVDLEELLSDDKEGFDVSINDLMSVANINDDLASSENVELL